MAKKQAKAAESTKPRFPYTNSPNALRKLLSLVPNKPKPSKLSIAQLAAWGFTSSNDRSMIPVLKAVNLTDASGTPTKTYDAFMMTATGPSALGAEIRKVYSPLFGSTHNPQNEQPDELKRLFNLHSGGGEATIGKQIQTFKALCEFASFDASGQIGTSAATTTGTNGGSTEASRPQTPLEKAEPTIHIDLHIHLPENKSSRDYRYIFEDIARLIYRQEIPSDET